MMTTKEERKPLLDETTSTSSAYCSDENTKSSGCSACDPRSTFHRGIVLALLSTIGVGVYFCTASPSALQNHFLEDLHISETKYMSFYSSIQWTSIIACIFGGFLIDRIFGNRIGIVLFSILVAGAHALFAMGALLNSYWLMLVARGIYGAVSGPMAIACDNMSVKWFKTNINMVLGLKTSIARLSSVVALNVLGPIYDYLRQFSQGHICLGITLFSGTLVAVLSFIGSAVMAWFDKRADNIEKALISDQVNNAEVVRFSVIKDFPATYWFVSLTTTLYYMALFPFVGLGQVFFEMKYEKDPDIADNVNSMVYLMAAITMPIFGILIDKVGRSLDWMIGSILLSVVSHAILAFTFVEPYVATVALGVGYSMFTATMWPQVSYLLPLNHLGTAYGIMNAFVTVGLAASASITGYLVDTSGYLVLEVFFIACMTSAFIFGSLLYIIDQSKDGVLNLGSREKRNRSDPQQSKLIQEVNVSIVTGSTVEKET